MNKKGKSTLEKLRKELRFKNYSDNSIKIYLHYAEVFLSNFNNDIYHISQSEAVKYLLNQNYSSISTQSQIISSVKSLYKYVLGVKLKSFNLERPRKEKKLPRVIDSNFLKEKLSKISNLKHKAILSITYSVGLRVSEVINLKIIDIDSKRMIINVRNAKGRKDRILPLSENILKLLREYFKIFKPKDYLFNGQNNPKYSRTSCNKLVKKYLGKNYHFHLLRHSSFTSMLENGTDLRIIQKIAGHSSSKTTEIYTHVSKKLLNSVTLPI